MFEIPLSEAYTLACRALGEAIVHQHYLASRLPQAPPLEEPVTESTESAG
jgi:hypothetical protein